MASKENPPTPPQRSSKPHKRHSQKKTLSREMCKLTESPTVNPPPTVIDTTPTRKKKLTSTTNTVQLEFVNEIQTQAHEIHIIDETVKSHNNGKKSSIHESRSSKTGNHNKNNNYDQPNVMTFATSDLPQPPERQATPPQSPLPEEVEFNLEEPKYEKHHKRKKSEGGRKLNESKSIYRKLLNRIKLIVDRTDNTDKNSETDELPIPIRYYPESLNALSQATKFTQQEIKRIYRGFKAECPTGMVGEDTFKDIYSQFFPLGASTGQYAHYVFQSIDIDRSGTLSFEEFLINLSILSRGSLEEKLEWTFSLYDINGDGCITRDEMTHIITSVYELMGRMPDDCPETEQIKEKVDHIFRRMDRNCDGIITLEEFVDCCRNDVTIRDAIAAFDTSF